MSNIQLNTNNENGEMEPLYPITKANNVKIEPKGNVPETAKTMEDVVGSLGTLAFEDSIDIPVADTEQYGLTKLSDVTNDETATDTAASTAALSKVAAESIKSTEANQEINGELSVDSLVVGGARLTTSIDESGNAVLTVDI